MPRTYEWDLHVALLQNVNWTSDAPLINDIIKKIREKINGPDEIFSGDFILRFDCGPPDCDLTFDDPDKPDSDWSKFGENFNFGTDDVGIGAKKGVADLSVKFQEKYSKPEIEFKVEQDGSSCIVLSVKVRMKRVSGGEVSFDIAGSHIPLFGGQDPPEELYVRGKFRICCCVTEDEEVQNAPKEDSAYSGIAKACSYQVGVLRWETKATEDLPIPVPDLYWKATALLGPCGNVKLVTVPEYEPTVLPEKKK